MINKDINSIQYSDIEKLQHDKVPESDTLDYKVDMIDNEKLLKHLCAFANTRGGDIIFGIKEPGDGRHPEEITGLSGDINKESIEQVVLSNIVPRLPIKIHLVAFPDDEQKTIMIIRVPDSNLKPHFDSKSQKYYKRFQFESNPMTEQEVCDCYRRRFSNHDTLEQYISDNTSRKAFSPDGLLLNIIIIPSNIEHRLIDTSGYKKLKWIEDIKMKYPNCASVSLPKMKFFDKGIKFKDHLYPRPTIEIHRNGCIVYRQYFKHRTPMVFSETYAIFGLLNILKLGSEVLSHYGYFGEVRLSVHVDSNSKMKLLSKSRYDEDESNTNDIHMDINREHPLQYVMDNLESIAESIMNDIVNNFDEERCAFFKKGKIDREKL